MPTKASLMAFTLMHLGTCGLAVAMASTSGTHRVHLLAKSSSAKRATTSLLGLTSETDKATSCGSSAITDYGKSEV